MGVTTELVPAALPVKVPERDLNPLAAAELQPIMPYVESDLWPCFNSRFHSKLSTV